MHEIKLTVDVTLPGMAGGTTTDLATIQENILAIQNVSNKKIYTAGDIRNSRVLVVTNVHQFICIINIKMRELSGYMSFINSRSSEFDALDIFHILCPVKDDYDTEMQERFVDLYRHIKDNQESYTPQPVYFLGKRKKIDAELMY